MFKETIKQIIENEPEKKWLEYKEYWYWKSDEKTFQNSWGELLKDFSALFNTSEENESQRYLIIGVNETTKKLNDYDKDINQVKIENIKPPNELKIDLTNRLRKFFVNRPKYKDSHTLLDIDNFYEIEEVEIESIRILVFTIHDAPYYLELQKYLDGNESFREGTVPCRRIKKDGSPEIYGADQDMITTLNSHRSKKIGVEFEPRETTIEKIVTHFKNRIAPSANLGKKERASIGNAVIYEKHTIKGEYIQEIKIFYFSKYTNQLRTINHLKTHEGINSGKILVITDEENRSHGKIDIERLKTNFSKINKSIEVFYIQEFISSKINNNSYDNEIFHNGTFNISDFIKPYTEDSREKTADILMSEWLQKENSPLLVIKGEGGIGKTTLVKQFLDNVYKSYQGRKHIIFISSHEIINELVKNPKVNNLFDFYNLLTLKTMSTNTLDQASLEISVDSGSLIIVLDGIDEVISKIGSRFNTKELIDSIFNDYSSDLGKTKVIITCRDYFWSDDYSNSKEIRTIKLLPFNKDLAKKYFEKRFPPAKVKKCMTLADEFALDEGKDKYIPYVLDMIREDLMSSGNKTDGYSGILNINKTNDFIIYKTCDREITKLGNMPVDKQLELIESVACEHNGYIHDDNLKRIAEEMSLPAATYVKFRGHPLFKCRDHGITQFRYDFFTEYMKGIAISSFIKSRDKEKRIEKIKSILKEVSTYESEVTNQIKNRVSQDDVNDLKVFLYTLIEENKEHPDHKLSSAIFTLILTLDNNKGRESNTKTLNDIYTSENKIKNLAIINLHSNSGAKPIFDFRGAKLSASHFENYESFSECSFDNETYFDNCTFLPSLKATDKKPGFIQDNFDLSTCNMLGLNDIINEIALENDEKEQSVRSEVKKILRAFWVGSSFKIRIADDINKKFKNNRLLIEKLKGINVIKERMETTRDKRNDLKYYISSEYSDLRKVMEENSTCRELEDVIIKISEL